MSIYRKGNEMGNKELFFEITKIMNNIKNHDFSVQTYRMSEEESKVVMRALEELKNIVGSWVDRDAER